MSDELQNHPESDQLRAFGLGQLEAAQAAEIAEHLDGCTDCCDTILNLQEDTFIGLVRHASQPVETLVPKITSFGVDTAEFPAGLQDHPRYEVTDVIGRGGMGYVYRARHRMMDRTVALKIISHRVMALPDAVDRFHREVKATAQLSHPNVVTAHDAEQVGGTHFLVMEYVDGVDLAQLVKQQGALPFAEACDCIRQAAQGLQYAQEQNMVHRDVKPQNLMLTDDGTVKILDFGLASLVPSTKTAPDDSDGDDQLTEVGSIVGTPDYMSPEQAQDAHQADIRSDIYSLGHTFHFLLAGRSPFAGLSVSRKLQMHADGSVDLCSGLPDDVPPEVVSVLQKMTATDPAERFQQPFEVAVALQEYASSAQYHTPSPSTRPLEPESMIPSRTANSRTPPIWRYLRRVWYTAMIFAAFATMAFLISIIVPKLLQPGSPIMVSGGTCVGKDGWWFQNGMVYLPQDGPGLLLGMHEGPSGHREVGYAVVFHHNATSESEITAAINSGTDYIAGVASVVDGIKINGKAIDLTMNLRLDQLGNDIVDTKMTFNGTDVDYNKGRLFVVDLTGDKVVWTQADMEFPNNVPSPRGLTEVKALVPEFARALLNQYDVKQLMAQSLPRHSLSDDQLRELLAAEINRAAGVPVEQWKKFATDPVAAARGIIGRPLSLALLSLPSESSPSAQSEFRYLQKSIPKPYDIHQAMVGTTEEGFVSLLQPEYITAIEFDDPAKAWSAIRTAADKAVTAHVAFEVPNLLAGRVECRIRFDGPRLVVDRFRLPARRLTLVKSEKGVWHEQEDQDTPAIRNP